MTEGTESQRESAPVSGWAGAPTERGHFRADIEGLRAVAVVAVLLFHAGVPGFAGGFIGVDVFYVISGFLITGLLRRELLRSGSVDLITFYARRARRLLPAALTVIAVTMVASVVVLPQMRIADMATDATTAALYVSNYRFALEGLDYLGDARTSPLLHYWSLAVEEQFYLVWPVLMLVSARVLGVTRMGWAIATIGVASLVASVVLTEIAAPIAFFSLPTRAWELAAGGLLAVAPEPLLGRVDRRWYWVIGGIGLGLIIGSAVLIDPALPFPGVIAVLPVAGAALVIVSGALRGGVAALLSTAIPRWLGRISYSLYLWHWPLLILVPIAIGQDNLPVRLALAGVAVLIADASTRWIEQPFRHGPHSRRRPAFVIATALVASAIVAGLSFAGGRLLAPPTTPNVPQAQIEADVRDPSAVLAAPWTSGPVPEEIRRGLAWAAEDIPESRRSGCAVTKLGTDPSPCVYGDETSGVTYALLGDSHMAQWLPSFTELASNSDWRVASFTKPACAPVAAPTWDERLARTYDECLTWFNLVIDRIAAEEPALIVMSSARNHELALDGGHFTFEERPGEWTSAIQATVARLRTIAPVVWIADTPRHETEPLECLALRRSFDECQPLRTEALSDTWSALELAAVTDAGGTVVSLNDLLCEQDACPLAFGDYLVYRDTHHLTATFA
ncbi:MAG TPA: acyltransferase family protein, partial [Candidatus Limnocylindrales bacterium]|nr:acyltransferase family protein [Candidatus Limnocylindrales bacterium]